MHLLKSHGLFKKKGKKEKHREKERLLFRFISDMQGHFTLFLL